VDRGSVTADIAVTIPRALPGFGVLVLAVVASSSACSSSGPRDATAPDAVQDAAAPDVRQDVAAPDAFPGDVEAPDAVQDGEAPDADQDTETCVRTCALGAAIGCPSRLTCVSQCRQDLASGVCPLETHAAYLCLIAGGTDAVICINGQTALKAGYCEPEKGALMTCLLATRDAGSD
jgi:hypothetical protein